MASSQLPFRTSKRGAAATPVSQKRKAAQAKVSSSGARNNSVSAVRPKEIFRVDDDDAIEDDENVVDEASVIKDIRDRARAYRSQMLPGAWSDADDAELVLRKFDVCAKYGPCANVSRRVRWQRAKDNGCAPPEYVRALLDVLDRARAAKSDDDADKGDADGGADHNSGLWDDVVARHFVSLKASAANNERKAQSPAKKSRKR